MLILSRKEGERFFIGDDIIIEVKNADPRSKNVKIGIQAPENLIILREELREKYTQETPHDCNDSKEQNTYGTDHCKGY